MDTTKESPEEIEVEEKDLLTREDLMLSVRKMKEYVEEKLQKDIVLSVRKMREYFDSKLKEQEDVHQKLYGEALGLVKSMTEEIKTLKEEIVSYQKELSETARGHTELQGQQKSLSDSWGDGITLLRKELFESTAKQFEDQDQWIRKHVNDLASQRSGELELLQKGFALASEALMERMKGILTSMPVPQVIFPNEAIKVLQSTPEVSIHVPQQAPPSVNVKDIQLVLSEKAFNLHVEQPAPHVHLPEGAIQVSIPPITMPQTIVNLPEKALQVDMQPSVVNVSLPEQKTPEVHVSVPRRKVKKTIKYDAMSRPEEVVEEEVGD